ncbi:hypothetical protein [Escherichia coli]|uniref:hypothetical protein n=1 Tax=Escherichia coli TaxID=562 RepID=UPI000CFDE10F|nr:hypothetical protein [Escherichia coli]
MLILSIINIILSAVIIFIVLKGNAPRGNIKKPFNDFHDAQTFIDAYYSDLPVSLRCTLAKQIIDEAKTRDQAHEICLTEADRLFERCRKYVD